MTEKKRDDASYPEPNELAERFVQTVNRFGIELELVRRNSLFQDESVQVQVLDLTPEVFDPEIGAGGGQRETCQDVTAIDVAGQSSTGADGTRRWRLKDFICGGRNVQRPVSFVATAATGRPVTVTARIVSPGPDLEVDVFTWTPAGDPAPNVSFSWRCWAETFLVVD
jgi:hypothetical protein